MPLHLTKIAFGAKSYADIESWFDDRPHVSLNTKNRPTKHEELVAGSLFWIHQHALVARSPIIGFEQRPDRRWWIHLEPKLIRVHPMPKRAHQGWRYLKDEQAPADLAEGEEAGDLMPGKLLRKLSNLGLL